MVYKIKLTSPSGVVDYAEMTQDKSQVGADYLKYTINNEEWYAGLVKEKETSLKVNKTDGSVLWVQRDFLSGWKMTWGEIRNTVNFTFPKSGVYAIYNNKQETPWKTIELQKGDTMYWDSEALPKAAGGAYYLQIKLGEQLIINDFEQKVGRNKVVKRLESVEREYESYYMEIL